MIKIKLKANEIHDIRAIIQLKILYILLLTYDIKTVLIKITLYVVFYQSARLPL